MFYNYYSDSLFDQAMKNQEILNIANKAMITAINNELAKRNLKPLSEDERKYFNKDYYHCEEEETIQYIIALRKHLESLQNFSLNKLEQI